MLHQLLSGLSHVHAQKLLHRDIKPANVLLSSKGVAKLAEFGISSVLSSTLSQVVFTRHHQPAFPSKVGLCQLVGVCGCGCGWGLVCDHLSARVGCV